MIKGSNMTTKNTVHAPENGRGENSVNTPSSSGIKLLATGLLLGAFVSSILWWIIDLPSQESSGSEAKPLYWVAPMDDSYRRDKPGKSPMGMDLVPVYEESAMSDNKHSAMMSPGTIMIAPNVQQNMGVRTQKVQVGYLNNTITAVGSVAYDEDSIVHIHPRVEGWIDTLFIKAQGEEVKQGQPLYTLYSPELVSAQEEFLLALRRNDKRLLAGAKARLSSLNLSNVFIEALAKSQTVSQTVTFYAPQDGVVEALTIREGFFVKPGTTIMSIAQLDNVWVIADIPEKFAARIELHNRVKVSLGFAPDKTWQSHIDYIYPSLDAVTRTLKVRVPLSNENTVLKPNMFANVVVVPAQKQPSLLVPKSAVIRTALGARVVLSGNAGHFKSVAVKLGNFDDRFVEVIDGLLPGDEVVVSAQFLIDSESSKNSDLMRMSEPDNQATTTGKIIALPNADEEHAITASNKSAMITISRGPIEKWGRGPATMMFSLSPHIDISRFREGDDIVFTFVTGDEFTVVELKHAKESVTPSHEHESMKKHGHGKHDHEKHTEDMEHMSHD